MGECTSWFLETSFYQNNPVLSTACIIERLKAADMHLEHHENSLLLPFNFNHNRSGTEMQGNRELKNV